MSEGKDIVEVAYEDALKQYSQQYNKYRKALEEIRGMQVEAQFGERAQVVGFIDALNAMWQIAEKALEEE